MRLLPPWGVLVVGVQHSANRFVTDNLLFEKIDSFQFHPFPVHWPEIVEKAAALPMIVPMRNPFMVGQSWQNRGKPLKRLRREFDLLFEMIQLFNLKPLYLPVDNPFRQAYLKRIRRELWLPFLRTKWKRYASIEKDDPLTPENEQLISEIVEAQPIFYNLGYGPEPPSLARKESP